MSYLDLTGRVAIVTGGAQGIGLAIVTRLVNSQASVAIADINLSAAQDAAQNLFEKGGDVGGFACDVSDPGSVQGLIDAVLDCYDRIDILVNNAGINSRPLLIQDQTNEDWDRTLAVNLSGVFYCCRAVVPHMIKNGGGRIINISSTAGKEGNPKMIPYSAAKAGVIALTKALAKEVAQYNILVNAVTPGLIQTPSNRDLTPEQIQRYTEIIPIGRIGRPEEAGALVHWLASEEVTFSTGAVFDLSGGRTTY